MNPDQYAVFRGQALSVGRERAGISQPPPEAPVWGVFMEIAIPNGLVAILALADGTASVYSSNGRAIIGGHSYECVRDAAWRFLAFANGVREHTHQAHESPSPAVGRVAFYLRTDTGLIAVECGEAELRHPDHPLFGLYVSGHAVLTELRKVCDASESAQPSAGAHADQRRDGNVPG
jgi:hypothetical protein